MVRLVDQSLLLIADTGATQVVPPKKVEIEGDYSGLDSVGSVAAAVLIVVKSVMPPANGDYSIFRGAVAELCPEGVPQLRRCAAELAGSGCTAELFGAVDLSSSERSWWASMAHLRARRREDASITLRGLPAGRYPDAAPLLFWLSTEHRDSVRSRVALQLADRLDGSSAILRAANGQRDEFDPNRFRWLFESDASFDHVPAGSDDEQMRDLLAVLRGAEPPAKALQIPDELPLSVVDSLVDGGTAVRHAGSRAADELRYLAARLDPESVDDAALEELGFEDERIRRRLRNGLPVDSAAGPLQSSLLAGWVEFFSSGAVSADLRAEIGDIAEDLERFWAAPDTANVSESLARDSSLWPYLAGRLPDDATALDSPKGSAQSEFGAWTTLNSAVRRLYAADWERALEESRHVLRVSNSEEIRDEALNTIACAHWQLGNDREASQALESALEGNRNEALQVNLGVIASELSPELAAMELARLVNEGTSIELRCEAALRATHIWIRDEMPWESDHDEGMPLPIRDALRSIVVQPIPLDSFRSIVALQANLDDEWLSSPTSLASSPHRRSVEARVYAAKASGPVEEIEALTEVLRGIDPPQWVREERDALLGALTRHAFDDLSSSVALFALHAIESGLPVDPSQHDLIVPLAVVAACRQIDPEEGEPADKFFTLLQQGEQSARSRGEFDHLDELYTIAWDQLVMSRALYAAHLSDAMADTYNTFLQHNGHLPRWQMNMHKVRAAFAPVDDLLRQVILNLESLRRYRVSNNVSEAVTEILDNARLLRRHVQEVTK